MNLSSKPGRSAIVWDNGHALRQPDEDDDAEINATAATLLSGKITALREYVGRALGDEHQGEALGQVAGGRWRASR